MQQRYCGNCGSELVEGQRYCGNCGSPVHATARVPTPEADVPVPPPPSAQQQQAQQSPEAEPRSGGTRGPMLVLLGVFLVLAVVGTALGMAEANPNRDFFFRLGVGMGFAFGSILGVGFFVLFVSVIGYLALRGRGGLTFRDVIFSWPVVLVTAIVALLFVV